MRISAMLISATLMAFAPGVVMAEEIGGMSTSDFPPHKVIGWNFQLLDLGSDHYLSQRLVKA
jgi:hypothetical protein